MCRWLAYQGGPIRIEELLYRTGHSLIDQSLHARMGATTTNGDGFGLGWYGTAETPGLYRAVTPAWSDRNLRELAAHIESPLFFAHIRASTGTPIEQPNTHPFRHGRWLFMHNGLIRDFPRLRRELLLAVDPDLFPEIEGTTDSEVMFHLALTFGLERDPIAALERMVGFVEGVAGRHGVADPLQMTVAASDGERIYAVRYSSEGKSRSLFASTDIHALKHLYPDNPRIQALDDDARAIVSEPLGDLPGAWAEVDESTALVIQPGADEVRPFRPRPPA